MTGLAKACLWTLFAVGVLALLPLPFVRGVRQHRQAIEVRFRCLPVKVIHAERVIYGAGAERALWVNTRIGETTRTDVLGPVTGWRRIR